MFNRFGDLLFPRLLARRIESRLQRERARKDHEIDSFDELCKRDPLQVLAIVAVALESGGSRTMAVSTLMSAYRICQGAIVCAPNTADVDDALLVAALCRAARGHRVQLIISDGTDFSDQIRRLNQAGQNLGLTVAVIEADHAEDQRRQAYRASIVVCPLLQILKDRTRDLLQWPLKATASQRQFDRLYGRRSAARNRLLPDGASALVYQADRVLIDQLALKITVGESTSGGKATAAGAVHAFSLFKSYRWLGGIAGPRTSTVRDIRALYGARTVGGDSTRSYGNVMRDMDAQANYIADVVSSNANRSVHIEVLQEALAESLSRCLVERNIECPVEPGRNTGVVVHRERQHLEEHLSRLNGAAAMVVTTALDPAPGSVRRLQAAVDPDFRHSWLAVYSLDEALLARCVPAGLLGFAKYMWHPALGRLLEPVVASLAAGEERRQRLAFVESLSVHRRRFAFAPHWGQRYE